MVVPFGVSVGDFITTIALIHRIYRDLGDTHGAASHYRAVKAMLDFLESVSKHLLAINCDDDALTTDLQHATEQFKASIDRFLGKIQKFHPSLKDGGSPDKVMGAFHKIQWTVFHKNDVHDFQAEISGTASGIQIILLKAQL